MIKTLIFDFGNVFINLKLEEAIQNAFNIFEINEFSEEMISFNALYEQGLISTNEFIEFYLDNFPELTEDKMIDIWNFMLKDFPKQRFQFLKDLKTENKYELILLSNTNELHINYIKESIPFYEEFKACFDKFYLSHEIRFRKPNKDVFEFVLNENDFKANECLFIDDNKENTDIAEKLGIHCWNIDETSEDVINLFNIKSDLF